MPIDLVPYQRRRARDRGAAVIAVTATVWRSHFMFLTRAYRFVLPEQGHVTPSVLLVATALGLSAVPLGRFYDGRGKMPWSERTRLA